MNFRNLLGAKGLTQTQVDARVVAVASGKERKYLRPGVELMTSSIPPQSNGVLLGGSYYRADVFTLSASEDSNFFFTAPLPKRWDQGGIRARFYWQPSNTDTGDVKFRILALSPVADGEAFGDTIGVNEAVIDAANGTADVLQITDWTGEITLSGIGDDHFVGIIFQRQAGSGVEDTFTGTSQLIGVEIEYTTNAPTDD